jgi:hypothetical protein
MYLAEVPPEFEALVWSPTGDDLLKISQANEARSCPLLPHPMQAEARVSRN